MSASGTELSPGVGTDLPTFTTLLHLQRHTEWVSQPPAQVPALLQAAGFTLLGGVIDPPGTGGQAYVATHGQDVVIAFRGSQGETELKTIENIADDALILRAVPRKLNPPSRSCRVHDGFYRNYLQFRDAIHQRLAQVPQARVFVTGFSLGSALAALCAFDIATNLGRPVTAHMLGTVRTGNLAWKKAWEAAVPAGLRFALEEDYAARIPLHVSDSLGFNHVARLLETTYDGTPVPLDRLDGRFRDGPSEDAEFSAHNRDKYAAAISAFIQKFRANPQVLGVPQRQDPLRAAAQAEAKSVDGLFGGPPAGVRSTGR